MNKREQIYGIALTKEMNGKFIKRDDMPFLATLEDFVSGYPEKKLKQAESVLEYCRENGITFIPCVSETFPEVLLRNVKIPEIPAGLFIKGNNKLRRLLSENSKVFSIVGTRDMSPYGRSVTESIVKKIAETHPCAVIVSGLAYGVDATAHTAALKYGLKTVAVMPCGLDMVYPSIHERLAEEIIGSGGALISHYAPGTPPNAINFLLRNHIIAALAGTVIVTESKDRGGAVVTARLAYDYGKRVLAVPGRLDDIRSAGCNRLIKDGIAEILIEL